MSKEDHHDIEEEGSDKEDVVQPAIGVHKKDEDNIEEKLVCFSSHFAHNAVAPVAFE